ncbi:MAG: glycosyltransferase family 39 protein, partial [Acidobacteria bacterium]|nr:glycosyltransferase family 39 protein [Acidobacteriota bacterium]
MGQAVALQMIDAGPLIHYQHWRPLRHPWLFICLAAQSAAVIAGLRRRWPDIRTWLGRNFRWWQLGGVGVVLFLSGAALSRDKPAYVAEMLFAGLVQAVNLGGVVLAAWAVPPKSLTSLKEKFDRWLEPSSPDRFVAIGGIWVTTLAAFLSFCIYERHPHIPDEVVYLYQARYFAAGRLTLPAPEAPDAINVDLMTYESDRWYCPVPPGWPAMLAVGVLLGVPWLVNPVLAGCNVVLTYFLVREIYDRRTARLSVLLLCVSPWHIFMAMNFMTHTFTLTCALAGALGVAWARKTGKTFWGWLSGIATGMVILIRPLEGAVVAGVLGLWALGAGGRRLKSRCILAFTLGAIVVGGVVLPYNKLLTGN